MCQHFWRSACESLWYPESIMRRIRRVFLLVLILVAAAVGWIFYEQKRTQTTNKTAPPEAIPAGMSMTAQNWQWAQEGGNKPKVHVSARNFRQMDSPPSFELEGVELKIFQKDGKEYDLVKSEKATFSPKEGKLYSEGDVEITMAVPVEDKPQGRVVMIRSSGVTFDSNEAKAWTDRATSFALDTGSGKAGIYRLSKLEEQGLGAVSRLPFSIRVLLESVLRNCDGYEVREEDVKSLATWNAPAPAKLIVVPKPSPVERSSCTPPESHSC